MTYRTLENKLKISLVSYLNTKPFLYGISHSIIPSPYELQLDTPAENGRKILQNEVDIALAPVAVMYNLTDGECITNFCIGAEGKVGTVCVFSNEPIDQVRMIYADNHSLTSVNLLRILLHEYWKVQCDIKSAQVSDMHGVLPYQTAILAIGDKSFSMHGKFAYAYDLAEAWHGLTGLPFVFAAWIKRRAAVQPNIIEALDNALRFGISNLDLVLSTLHSSKLSSDALKKYFTQNISYEFDDRKQAALDLFLKKMMTYKKTPIGVL
jgi:chorismate dehydratase